MKIRKAKHKLPSKFESALAAVYESEFGFFSKKFLFDLQHVFEADASDDVPIEVLKRLESELKKWGKRCGRELKNELAKLPKNHPVRCPISLLGTRGYGRLEVAHTRTLACLLNPKEAHGFGNALLDSLLRHLRKDRELPPFDVEEVDAERFYRNSDEEDAGRTDIWIELSWRKGTNRKRWLVVIEAKVDASEGNEQLDRYGKEIKKWLAEHKGTGHEVYQIFLTREGDEATTGKRWKPLSFSNLVRVFCDTANSLTAKPGYHFLRFYLAGVLKDILDLPIGQGNGQQNQYKLLGFLKGS